MSHLTATKTQVKNLDLMKKVLKQLMFQYREDMEISSYQKVFNVDLAINIKNLYWIGLKANDSGAYEAVADWDELNNFGLRNWQKILQEYSIEAAKEDTSTDDNDDFS